MKKQPPLWLCCLLLIVLTLLMSKDMLLPITAQSGTEHTLTLEQAWTSGNYIYLDFNYGDAFRMVRSFASDALLEDSAWDKPYTVVARYNPSRRGPDYYDVLALTGPDGTAWLTIEQSEAIRQAMLPTRLGLLALLVSGGCMLIAFVYKKRAHTTTKEASP